MKAHYPTVRQNHENNSMRRWFKLMCAALNRRYGFGHDRLMELIDEINQLSEDSEKDEIFWTHMDRLMESIGMDFDKEREKV